MKKFVRTIGSAVVVAALASGICGATVMADELEENDGGEVVEETSTNTPDEESDGDVDGDAGVVIDIGEPAVELYGTPAFVARLYECALGRSYDYAGLDEWTERIESSEYTINQVANLFIHSDEFNNHNYSDEEYIKVLYATFLNRVPAEAEVKSWTDYIAGGASRDEVLSGFTLSTEWGLICNEYGISNPDKVVDEDIQTIHEFVDRFYSCFLGRPADVAGMKTWTDILMSGEMTAVEVSKGFIYSQEFTSKSLPAEEYVATLYKAFLGRTPDEGGLATWSEFYNHGVSNEFFIMGFAHSGEFTAICESYGIVRGEVELTENRDIYTGAQFIVYDVFSALNRPVAPDVWNDTISALNNLEGMATYVRTVFNSAEYANRNVSDEEFAQDLYRCVVGREATDSEVQAIVNSLKGGKSRSDIVDSIIENSEYKSRCEAAGVRYKRLAAPAYLSKELQDAINSQAYDLSSAFEYSYSQIKYWRHDVDPHTVNTAGLAAESFTRGEGNCYGMAAVFLEMAKNLGYQGVQIYGQVPSASGGMTPHSWVELTIDGTVYVCDPDFVYDMGRKGQKVNGLLIQYGQKGTWRYVREGEIAP